MTTKPYRREIYLRDTKPSCLTADERKRWIYLSDEKCLRRLRSSELAEWAQLNNRMRRSAEM